MSKTLQFIIDHWLIIAPVLYEIIVRIWPTNWNISLLDNVWKLLNLIIPNIRKPDGKEVLPGQVSYNALPEPKKKGLLKNLVKVAINRFVLKCVLILFVSSPAFSQNNIAAKAVASYNADSATVRSYISTLQTTYGNVGGLYYNKQSSKWRIYEDSTWRDLTSGSGSGGGTVTNVSGTTNRITVTNPTTTPVVDIAATYAGQTSITTLGTVATGVWNATTIPTSKGGTGLVAIGTPLQFLRTNLIANGLEYASMPYVMPEDYGAVGNGSANDATAIQNAVNSGFPVYFSQKNYRISTSITLPANTRIIGSGSGCIISTVTNITCFAIQGNNVSIQSISFTGNDGTTAQIGISAVGNGAFTATRYGITITDVRYNDLGNGFYATNIVGGSAGSEHQGGVYMNNCVANSCSVNGYFLDVRAEYNTFSNNVAYLCATGLRIIGGNNNWTGGQITDCPTGIVLATGSNAAHGSVTGTKVNHNTTTLSAASVTEGFIFNGCDFFAGTISITSCTGIRFMNCDFGLVTTITGTTNTGLEFLNNRFVTNPTFTLSGTTRFFGNTFETGTIPPAVVNTLTAPLVTTPTATLSGFNPGTLAGDPSSPNNGDIVYNTVLNALRARINGTWVSLGAGGISNTAAANEIMKSNGTNAVPSGIFSTTAADINLGSVALTGNRTITATSTDGTTDISIVTEGSGSQLFFAVDGSAQVFNLVNGAIRSTQSFYVGSTSSDVVVSLQSGDGGDVNVTSEAKSASGGTAGNANLTGGSTITTSTADAGNATVTGGNVQETASGIPGDVVLTGGNAVGSGGGSGDIKGGDIVLNPGAPRNGGQQGLIIFNNLPTSCAGLPTGALANVSGILNVCP